MSALLWIGILLLCTGLALSQYKKIVTFISSMKSKAGIDDSTPNKLRKWKVKKEKKFFTPKRLMGGIIGVVCLSIGVGLLIPSVQKTLSQINSQYNASSEMSPTVALVGTTAPLITFAIIIVVVVGIIMNFMRTK